MEGTRFIDIYATKGIEYLVVIAFLVAFAVFVHFLFRSRARESPAALPDHLTRFRIPDGFYFHRGHGWLRPESASVATLGLNDFAQKLVGKVDAIHLPPVGTHLEQGGRAWNLVVGSEALHMLSPAGGEVVEVNRDVIRSPSLVHDDPYGKGWLVKVRSPRLDSERQNLLHGKVARAWMEETLGRMQPVWHAEGPVMQDGGLVVDSVARAIGGDNWHAVAREHLSGEESSPPASEPEVRSAPAVHGRDWR
jgi:glycine cleavage system H lipoate-binding protein